MRTPKYGFIIKTNKYAGNFEREICAYITGNVGECGVGSEYARKFKEEEKIELECYYHTCDDGCPRPVEILDNDTNSLVIYFEDKPSKKEIELMKRRVILFGKMKKNNIKIIDFRLEKYLFKTTIL